LCTFIETTGRDIKLTHEHLILAGAGGSSAEMSLVAAGKITEGMCVMILSTKLIQGPFSFIHVKKDKFR
jgi:hypothetical protein